MARAWPRGFFCACRLVHNAARASRTVTGLLLRLTGRSSLLEYNAITYEDNASACSRTGLHFAPEDCVHISLVFLAPLAEPGEHIGVHAKADQLLHGPVEATDLDVVGSRGRFRSIRII